MKFLKFLYVASSFVLFAVPPDYSHAQTIRVPARKIVVIPAPIAAPAAPVAAPAGQLAVPSPTTLPPLVLTCSAVTKGPVSHAFDSQAVTITGGTGTGRLVSSSVLPAGLSLNATTGAVTGTPTSIGTFVLQATDSSKTVATNTCPITITLPDNKCDWAPTRSKCMDFGSGIDANINTFYDTAGKLSYFDQIKSIYNGASSSATISADLASLNFSNGMQVTAGTNIQAGSSSPTDVTTGTIPTLSSTSAGQATQNMLYGGTIFASALYPLLATGVSNLSSAGGLGFLVDLVGKEGVDLQNFKAGTSTNVSNPPSHTSVQMEGYLQYNSTNFAPGSTSQYAGSIFVGGSYGYSFTSHDYARDYGFGSSVNNGIGQVSAGMVISGVAKIALSRGFGPSQTYIDSTTMTQTTVNNFKSWSFGITYQAPATN